MFCKTIFKQTLNQNWKLWMIFTIIPTIMSMLIITVYDPKMVQGMMNMIQNVPGVGDILGDRIETMSSLLAMLGENFYMLPGYILPLIYVIMTANSLIASQVDRGSMAYILSTPIKRTKVVRTQAFYLITAIFCTFLVITTFGFVAVQAKHNALWGQAYTADVKAASTVLNFDNDTVANDLTLILNNQDAVRAGAKARGIDDDVYIVYLGLKMSAAEESAAPTEQAKEMQEKLMSGIVAAADALDMEAADLTTDMSKIKGNSHAMAAAVKASGLPQELFTAFINRQLATDEITFDKGVDFSVKGYLMINLGAFLMFFAISSISFLFSCVFNLTKNSLALGAGIPIAFFIFHLMSQFGSSLENLKYLSLNTLFAAHEIVIDGVYIPQFIALAVIGSVLYLVGIKVFKEKDLPL
ncbi:MAG: ABC-2 transporter permease [Lachnospiraceae bacterium]|nr:ABC-2 transporter permease [Lachnospiraceae bacterium]